MDISGALRGMKHYNPKRHMRPNTTQQRQHIREIFPSFKKDTRYRKNISRIINTITFLSFGAKCERILSGPRNSVFFKLCSRKTVRFLGHIMPADKYPSIFSR